LFIYQVVFSQEKPRRTLSIQEWIDEMVNCMDSVYRLENADIVYDEEKDKNYLEDSIEIVINPEVAIINCNFDKDIYEYFRFLTFMNDVYIKECTGTSIQFSNCKFETGIEISNSKFKWVLFLNVNIKGWFKEQSNNIELLTFNKSTFESNSKRKNSYPIFFQIDSENIGILNIFDSKFIFSDSIEKLKIDLSMMQIMTFAASIEKVNLINDTFELPVSFINFTANKGLTVKNCLFRNYVDMQKINFPERNTNFDWKLIADKICVIENIWADSLKIYLGKTDDEFKIGRAHVLTPVTDVSRMPSSA